MTAADEQIFEIRTHLLYEVKWMIFAASRFAQEQAGDAHVALIDSATVHARNLFEFAGTTKRARFTLKALGGVPVRSTDWDRWANNRVTHMHSREHDRAPWPDALDNSRPDRLMVMAGTVLDRLEQGGTTVKPESVKAAYDEVIGAARAYWDDPTDARHHQLNALYDGSRDDRAY